MAFRPWFFRVATVAVFIGLVFWWLNIAYKKPLWNDELYSQVASIQGQSYWGMFSGHIQEGNITPLFYLVQKAWADLCHYQTPQFWLQGQWGYNHPFSNGFLRVWPVVSMAAGIAAIFYYFCARWNAWTGLYSLLVSLSSFMVWSYAFQARPYALWFLLTALQMIALLCFIDAADKDKDRYLRWLNVLHWLLAFTVVFSVIQNFASCLVLGLSKERRWRTYAGLGIAPAAVSLFYYFLSPKYHFWLKESFMGLLGASLPLDRLLIIALAAVLLGIASLKWSQSWFGRVNPRQGRGWRAALLFTFVVFAGCWAVLMKFQAGQTTDQEGFQVSNRYFMVLAPAGIIMTTMASYYIAVLPKGMLKKAAWIFLAVFFALRLWRVWLLVISKQISG